jgi:hypothetical protein
MFFNGLRDDKSGWIIDRFTYKIFDLDKWMMIQLKRIRIERWNYFEIMLIVSMWIGDHGHELLFVLGISSKLLCYWIFIFLIS